MGERVNVIVETRKTTEAIIQAARSLIGTTSVLQGNLGSKLVGGLARPEGQVPAFAYTSPTISLGMYR
jgi:hypothetical protein